MDRHLPHDTARNARFFIGVVNAAKMGILSAGQQREAGADEQAAALPARDPAAHAPLDSPDGVAWLLAGLRAAGADEQAAALAGRAAAHAPLDSPDGVATLLARLRAAGAHEQAAALAAGPPPTPPSTTRAAWPACWPACGKRVPRAGRRAAGPRPAAHAALDDPVDVASLLASLRAAGAHEQAAALASRAAAHAPLDNPGGVASLLDSLREAGATSKPPRWPVGCRRSACSGSSSSSKAPWISSVSGGRLTAPRPHHGAGKTWTYGLSSSAGTYCTGAGLSGMPTWAGMRHGSPAHGRQHRNRRDELNNPHPNRPGQLFEAQLAEGAVEEIN